MLASSLDSYWSHTRNLDWVRDGVIHEFKHEFTHGYMNYITVVDFNSPMDSLPVSIHGLIHGFVVVPYMDSSFLIEFAMNPYMHSWKEWSLLDDQIHERIRFQCWLMHGVMAHSYVDSWMHSEWIHTWPHTKVDTRIHEAIRSGVIASQWIRKRFIDHCNRTTFYEWVRIEIWQWIHGRTRNGFIHRFMNGFALYLLRCGKALAWAVS